MNAPPELVAQVRRDLTALAKHAPDVTARMLRIVSGEAEAARGLVEQHVEVRSLGELASRGAEEADELLRLAVDDGDTRTQLRALVACAEVPAVFRALSRALPRSFRAVTAEEERTIRARARGAADQRVWPDLPVKLRDVFVPPPAGVSEWNTGSRPRSTQEPGVRVDDVMAALHDALVQERVIVLAGAAGSGRTTVAAMLADSLADDTVHLPLWLDRATLTRLSEAEASASDASTVLGVDERRLARRGGVVAIADGIDDIPGKSTVLGALLGALKRGTFTALVLTSRRESVASMHPLPSPSQLVELEPFDRARIDRWSARWRHALGAAPDFAQGFEGSRYLDAPADTADELGDALSDLVKLPFGLSLLANLHAHKRPLPDPSTTRRRAGLIREVLDRTCAEVAQRADVSAAFAREALRRLAVVERAMVSGDARRDRWEEHLELDRFSHVLVEFRRSFLLGAVTGGGFVHGAFGDELAAEFVASRLSRIVQRSDDSPSGFAVDDREAGALWVGAVGLCQIDQILLPLLTEMFPDWSAFANGRRRSDAALRSALQARLPSILLHLMRDGALDATVAIARATGSPHSLVLARSLAACFALSALTEAGGQGRLFMAEQPLASCYPKAWGHIKADLGSWYMDEMVQPRISLRGCSRDLLDTIIEETDLSFVDLSSLDLSAAVFNEGSFFGTSFRDADLRSSQWTHGTFQLLDFTNADLRGATFVGSRVWDCDLTNTVLIGVDLSRTALARTDLSKAILTEDDARARGVTLRP